MARPTAATAYFVFYYLLLGITLAVAVLCS